MDVPASLSACLPACRCACVWPCEPIGEMDVWERAGGRSESRFGDALRLQLVVVVLHYERASRERAKFMNGPPLRSVVRRDAIRSSDLSDRRWTGWLHWPLSLSSGRRSRRRRRREDDHFRRSMHGRRRERAAIKCAKNGAIES